MSHVIGESNVIKLCSQEEIYLSAICLNSPKFSGTNIFSTHQNRAILHYRVLQVWCKSSEITWLPREGVWIIK